MAERARAFSRELAHVFDITVAYRHDDKHRAIREFLAVLGAFRPHVSYVFDLAYSGVFAAALHRARAGCPWVVDTGDAIYALAKSAGLRGPLGTLFTGALEQFGLRAASAVVVRGTEHRTLLSHYGIDATVIQDGVDVAQFLPRSVEDLRSQLGLHDVLSIGVLGSSNWRERHGTAAGWELLELLKRFRGRPVKGVLIGDGSGIPVLRQRCSQQGLDRSLLFIGRVPYASLPDYLSAVDVFLSTQTNDVVGRVRTTGKLPLYLASGRYVLASRVGEAARVLPEEMLVEYRGVVDADYPDRLAERIETLLAKPERLQAARALIQVAWKQFSYPILAKRLRPLLERMAEDQ